MSFELDFGLKIKRLIESNKETYEQAAQRLGSNRSTVNRWTRQKDIDTSILKQLCKTYKIPMSYFISESVTYSQNNEVVNGGINAVGEKIIQYQQQSNNTGQSDEGTLNQKILIERLKSCEEKNALLQKMVSILEKK